MIEPEMRLPAIRVVVIVVSSLWVLFSQTVLRNPVLGPGETTHAPRFELPIAPEEAPELLPSLGMLDSPRDDSPLDDSPVDSPVVHIIETRFLQHQPHLVHFGLAMLELFKALCLPTMQNQTSPNFLWFIRTDPDLDPVLKDELLRLVGGNNRFVVIASTTAYNVLDRTGGEGFRESLDFNQSQVWTGNYALVERYHALAQSRIMINTQLDADDGLHVGFVEHLQKEVERALGDDAQGWGWWCTMSTMEWQYNSPWTPPSPSGCLLTPPVNQFCVTPGLTKAYGPGIVSRDVTYHGHVKMHVKLPPCRGEGGGDGEAGHCLAQMPVAIAPYAIRGRTPTSAGMRHVFLQPGEPDGGLKIDVDALKGAQEAHQASVWTDFAIDSKQLAHARSHLAENLRLIAEEALKGQCRGTHSCKPTTQDKLKRILTSTTEGGGINSTSSDAKPKKV
mmetsp:Transcript_26432/g.49388  ORF Transcript_26432/g.49388 Transcript_26432/m.49388 type:complete len:448 (-) Transcript_26432:469-1812(-)